MLKRVRIGDLGDIYTGNTPSKKNMEFYDSKDIMFIKPDMLEFNIAKIEKANEYISEKAREKARIIPKGSLLVSCIGNIGKLGINNEEVAFNQQINAIIHNDKIISSKYLAYVIKYNQKKLESIANTAVVPIINKNQFSEFELLIHKDLEIQNKIVDILDKAQQLIDKRKEQIEVLDELVKSQFIEMFGDPILNPKNWEKSMLQECCFKITDGTHDTPKRLSNGKLLITGKNIRRDKIDLTDIEYVSEEDHQMIYKRCNPEYGDVLYTNIGTNYGTAVINSLNYEFSMKNVALLKPNNDKIIGIYLWYYLNLCRPYILEENKAGGAQTFMSLATIKKLNIFVPSLELQNQFADFVKQVDKLKFEMEKSLKELEDNFNALMQKAFKI